MSFSEVDGKSPPAALSCRNAKNRFAIAAPFLKLDSPSIAMPEPFKNLINKSVIDSIASRVVEAYPDFPHRAFRKSCLATLDDLELKDRSILIADCLHAHLPPDADHATRILLEAVRSIPELGDEGPKVGWLLFPFNSYLSRYGLASYDASIKLIREVTKRFTAEFGIRPFLIERPKPTLKILAKWTKDPNLHVRRLVSEGSRPRLPWGEQIPAFIKDPSPILPLLNSLKDDPEEYVRRSVANNLNDISKDHPELMLDIVDSWLPDADKNRLRLLQHACRSLIKAGHPRCLALLGFSPAKLAVESFALEPAILQLGERLRITTCFRSTAKSAQKIVFDYRFHFVKAKGQSAPKVFKGSQATVLPHATQTLQRRFHLKPVTTRKYYAGETRVELLANGKPVASASFTLAV